MSKIAAIALVVILAPASRAIAQPLGENKPAFTTQAFTKLPFRGRVVFMAEAMERLHGVKSVPESRENSLALEMADGTLHPLLEDKLGHSFRLDERLRGQPMELLVRRYEGAPALQVLRIHTIDGEKKFLLDYWCDICAIPMYELKPCDCCQGEIRLRKREVTPSGEVLMEVKSDEQRAANFVAANDVTRPAHELLACLFAFCELKCP